MDDKAVEVSGYRFTPQDRLFLDTNIWFYLYGPQKPRTSWVDIYSQAFDRILNAKSRIYIDVLAVSEFINVYARLKWKLVASHYREFKDFRSSADFKPIAQDIVADVKHVLKHCSRIESGFSTLEIDDLLADYAAGNSDFNDQVITELCRSNGLTLMTNDGDFRSQGIPVLTANSRLLR